MKELPKVSVEQAERGIYVDFEMNVGVTPSLLGWRCQDETHQTVLEPVFRPLVERSARDRQVSASGLNDALRALMEWCRREDRMVIGYSMHEPDVVSQFCSEVEVREWFVTSYVNAKRLIDRWVNHRAARGQIERPSEKTLHSAMRLEGLDYLPATGPGIVGPGLRRLRTALATHASADEISSGAKRHWARILQHNAIDLEATQHLTLAAVRGLARPRIGSARVDAVVQFAEEIGVDPIDLEDVIGVKWRLGGIELVGTGMGWGRTLVEAAKTPAVGITSSWVLRRPAKGQTVDRLMIGVPDFAEPPAINGWMLDYDKRIVRVHMTADWPDALKAAIAEVRVHPEDSRKRLISDDELIAAYEQARLSGAVNRSQAVADILGVFSGPIMNRLRAARARGLIVDERPPSPPRPVPRGRARLSDPGPTVSTDRPSADERGIDS